MSSELSVCFNYIHQGNSGVTTTRFKLFGTWVYIWFPAIMMYTVLRTLLDGSRRPDCGPPQAVYKVGVCKTDTMQETEI